LDDSCSYSDIIEETKPHMIIGLGVVPGRAHDGKTLLQLAACNSKTGFDNTPTT
jgi:hypothetical protein